MLEFAIDGADYRAGKLNAFQQLHVSRRLAGVLALSIPAMLGAQAKKEDLVVLLTSFAPAAEAIAAMPEADVDYIFGTCLSVVSRKQGADGWAVVWNAGGKVLMFSDIDLPVMTQLVFRVVQDSLGPFIKGLTASLAAASPTAAA